MNVKKLTLMAALTAAALIIFIIEAQIPIPLPIPGIKPGFANIITLFALFQGRGKGGGVRLTASDASMILICRIILGAVFSGRVTGFIYSLVGGLLSFLIMAAARRIVTDRQIWVCGALGAVFHNIGQIAAAMVITGTPSIIIYLPVLIVTGIVTGVFTGLIAQLTLARIGGAGRE